MLTALFKLRLALFQPAELPKLLERLREAEKIAERLNDEGTRRPLISPMLIVL